jgi:anti-anti-sigma factor
MIVVPLHHELDVLTAGQLNDDLRAVNSVEHMIIDLSRVTFFGAAGLRALLSAAQTQPNGRLVLRSPSRAVARLLAVTGVAERFDTIGSRRAPSSPEPSTTS